MKAPDKIYLERSLSFPDKLHSHWYKEDVVGNGVEYIRKDALMETLLTMEARHSVFYLEGKIVREIINKISSL